MGRIHHGHRDIAQHHGAAFVEADDIGALLRLPPAHQIVDPDNRHRLRARDLKRIAGMIAMGVGQQDMRRTAHRLLSPVLRKERVAGQPRFDQQNLIADFQPKSRMSQPDQLHCENPPLHGRSIADKNTMGCKGQTMGWLDQIDNYCERVDATFWSEPLNAVTNAAFLISAIVVWAMLGGKSDRGARILCGILAIIGTGSFLFHTFATGWASLADVLPILIFILTYLFFATPRFFDLPQWTGIAAVAGFFPFAIVTGWALTRIVGSLNGSVAYLPVALLIALYALMMRSRDPETSRGLAIGAGLLIISLTFRSIDEAVCPILPIGTHFLWHILNGVLLGWMILVLHRHLIR